VQFNIFIERVFEFMFVMKGKWLMLKLSLFLEGHAIIDVWGSGRKAPGVLNVGTLWS
jgi:hypothetical protein